ARGLLLDGLQARATLELKPNSTFLDIWGPPEAHGAGVLLERVQDGELRGSDLQHNQNGLLSYDCRRLRVVGNEAGYSSGWGFHLNGTSESLFQGNHADQCCRFNPRPGTTHFGHVGADAAGFLIVNGSCRNTFLGNSARLGGDGFFLAGLTPDLEPRGCDENLFEDNDASLSPNIAFEATFSRGNVFRGNVASRGNFGFWLGFSTDTTVEGNRAHQNRMAGVAAENATGLRVLGNDFQAGNHGLLLWSGPATSFRDLYPDLDTLHDVTVEGNTFLRNWKAVRVAANQDHGLRNLDPMPEGGRRPYGVTATRNLIQDNRLGLDLVGLSASRFEGNTLRGNVEANARLDDCEDVIVRDNLGAAGAYL
ncbi:MAG TPA: right-handed parallel beta-helix repeat-containing protein, partial [Deinococcales bacterium]|nr:right-handed parallel beta-helix repeat-containing protein [Deinococcales bacterium]